MTNPSYETENDQTPGKKGDEKLEKKKTVYQMMPEPKLPWEKEGMNQNNPNSESPMNI